MIRARDKLRAHAIRMRRTTSSTCSMRQSLSRSSDCDLPVRRASFFFAISGMSWCSRCCRMMYVSLAENCGSLDSSSGMVSASSDGQKLEMYEEHKNTRYRKNTTMLIRTYYSGVIFESSKLTSSSAACGNSPHL